MDCLDDEAVVENCDWSKNPGHPFQTKASSAKVRSVKNISRLRLSIGTPLGNKMSNLEWSQCDASLIRDFPDSKTGAAREGRDKVNCHAFVQTAHRQKMQKKLLSV